MDENFKRRKRTKRKKSGPSTGLIIGLALGGGLLVLVLGGVGLYFALGKSKINPLAPGGLLELPNSRVTIENYGAVKNGDTLAQVEAVMGSGRAAIPADFDASFPKEGRTAYNASQQNRAAWEANNARDLVRVWSNGRKRLLLAFTQPPGSGGRVFNKVFVDEDGSISMESGTGAFGNPQPVNQNTLTPPTTFQFTRPTVSTVPVASLTADALLAEFEADSKVAMQKYQGKRVTITGTAKQVQQNVILFQAAGATLQATITGAAVTEKKAGETFVLTGTVRYFFDNSHMLMMDGCTLDN
jgi:hypothetical protein